jgi:toxin YoeB
LAGAGAAPRKREVHWTARRIRELVEHIREHPFTGIGKPEPLRYEWSGYWSRRITKEHRLVYRVAEDVVYIAQCRYHY